MKQQSIVLLLVSTLMSFQTLAQLPAIMPKKVLNATGLPLAPDCFFCDQDGKNIKIGSDNRPRAITDLTVVGKPTTEGLPSFFEPTELIDIDPKYMTPLYRYAYTPQYIAEGKMEKMRSDAYTHLSKMLDAAYTAKIDLYIHSAYRSYEIQCSVFSGKILKEFFINGLMPKMSLIQFKKDVTNGYKPPYTNEELRQTIVQVNTRSALPGQSEHQLGSVVDLVTNLVEIESYVKPDQAEFSGYALENVMELTHAFKWLQINAHKYGYVLSYPTPVPLFTNDVKAPHPQTGYIYEPWHWRYIGVERALDYKYCGGKYVLREYLKQVAANPKFSCIKAPSKAPPAKKITKKTTASWFSFKTANK